MRSFYLFNVWLCFSIKKAKPFGLAFFKTQNKILDQTVILVQ